MGDCRSYFSEINPGGCGGYKERTQLTGFQDFLEEANVPARSTVYDCLFERGRDRVDCRRPRDWSRAAHGFRNLAKDDFDNMRLQFPTYDALYKYCQLKVEGTQKLEYNVSQPPARCTLLYRQL